MRRLVFLYALPVFVLAGCTFAKPRATTDTLVARDLARHFDQVYAPQQVAGLMRPRFGIPAIATGDAPFAVVTLARSGAPPTRATLIKAGLDDAQAAACLASTEKSPGVPESDACIGLTFAADTSVPIEAFWLRVAAATPVRPPLPGAYDLAIETAPGVIERAKRAVFYRAPRAADSPLTIVQLSDVHLGHDPSVEPRLEQAISAINQLQPDAVIITGDMAEQGRTRASVERAGLLLQRLDAPVLVVLGNHDYGHFPTVIPRDAPDYGYFHFARTFHPFRLFRTTFDRWELIGFDSGPSLFSPMVVTRGIDEETLRDLRRAFDETSRHVLLFSHAPTRASIFGGTHRLGSNQIGSMHHGAAALERLLLQGSQGDRQALHLSGHTHWSDLFVSPRAGRSAERPWLRLPYASLPCAQRLDAGAVLVNAPSVTRISFETIDHAKSYGFVVLTLYDRQTVVQFRLFDAMGRALPCVEPS